MSVREVAMFTVDCDRCGRNADEGTDYSCWPDHESAIEMAKDGVEYQDFEGKLFCPECIEYDDETDEYRPKLEVVPAAPPSKEEGQ